MGAILSTTQQTILDVRLEDIQRILVSRNENATLAVAASRLLKRYTYRSNLVEHSLNHLQQGRFLLSPNWSRTWDDNRTVSYGLFGDIRCDRLAKSLHSVFVCLIRFVKDPIDREDSKVDLLNAVNEYLRRRGIAGPGQSIEQPDGKRVAIETLNYGPCAPNKSIPVKGVSLRDAAMKIRPNDPVGQNALYDAWRKSRSPKLPKPIGFAPEHRQRNLYEPAALLKFLNEVEGPAVDSDFGLSSHFRKIARLPVTSQPK